MCSPNPNFPPSPTTTHIHKSSVSKRFGFTLTDNSDDEGLRNNRSSVFCQTVQIKFGNDNSVLRFLISFSCHIRKVLYLYPCPDVIVDLEGLSRHQIQ